MADLNYYVRMYGRTDGTRWYHDGIDPDEARRRYAAKRKAWADQYRVYSSDAVVA